MELYKIAIVRTFLETSRKKTIAKTCFDAVKRSRPKTFLEKGFISDVFTAQKMKFSSKDFFSKCD